jgi:hypothetical protein
LIVSEIGSSALCPSWTIILLLELPCVARDDRHASPYPAISQDVKMGSLELSSRLALNQNPGGG